LTGSLWVRYAQNRLFGHRNGPKGPEESLQPPFSVREGNSELNLGGCDGHRWPADGLKKSLRGNSGLDGMERIGGETEEAA